MAYERRDLGAFLTNQSLGRCRTQPWCAVLPASQSRGWGGAREEGRRDAPRFVCAEGRVESRKPVLEVLLSKAGPGGGGARKIELVVLNGPS